MKSDKYEYYTSAIENEASFTDTIGELTYFRNINKIGYISSMSQGNVLLELTPLKDAPVTAPNPFQQNKMYYVKFRTNNESHKVYFSKTNNVESETSDDLLLAVNNYSSNNGVFKAPDPNEYPYIYVTTANASAIGAWFRFYENRNISDVDGASFNVSRSGSFANKPSGDDIYAGFKYMITETNPSRHMPIYYGGNSKWYDASGNEITA